MKLKLCKKLNEEKLKQNKSEKQLQITAYGK